MFWTPSVNITFSLSTTRIVQFTCRQTRIDSIQVLENNLNLPSSRGFSRGVHGKVDKSRLGVFGLEDVKGSYYSCVVGLGVACDYSILLDGSAVRLSPCKPCSIPSSDGIAAL